MVKLLGEKALKDKNLCIALGAMLGELILGICGSQG